MENTFLLFWRYRMQKNKTPHTSDTHLTDDCKLGYYELAVYFAAVQAQEEEFHWENFIDNLSNICDIFASHIKSNNVSRLEL